MAKMNVKKRRKPYKSEKGKTAEVAAAHEPVVEAASSETKPDKQKKRPVPEEKSAEEALTKAEPGGDGGAISTVVSDEAEADKPEPSTNSGKNHDEPPISYLSELTPAVSVHGSNNSAADSPVKPSAPAGPARMVLAVPDEPARGRMPVLQDELAAVVVKQQVAPEPLPQTEAGRQDERGIEPAQSFSFGEQLSLEIDDSTHGETPEKTARLKLKSVIESLIFVSDKPISVAHLRKTARARTAEVTSILDELIQDYRGRGIELAEVAGGYVFRSAPQCASFVRNYIAQRPVRLTQAQLETLSIVAYRQPVTRPEIEEVRGVDTGSAIKVLLDRGLLKMLGRKDEPGRPLLYGTTLYFLEFFGMKSLKDLPTLKEFSDLTEENRELYRKKTGENVEEAKNLLFASDDADDGLTASRSENEECKGEEEADSTNDQDNGVASHKSEFEPFNDRVFEDDEEILNEKRDNLDDFMDEEGLDIDSDDV
ncbi:MAG: SMC-Scp complex subunit ScpB [Deltaproteobacteria bacterium]|nr:SMC-Scp complex subunit ScpB [Deltaproteobacteria bacterium]